MPKSGGCRTIAAPFRDGARCRVELVGDLAQVQGDEGDFGDRAEGDGVALDIEATAEAAGAADGASAGAGDVAEASGAEGCAESGGDGDGVAACLLYTSDAADE